MYEEECVSLVVRKPVLAYATNKDADHSAHLRSLISTFVIRCLDIRMLAAFAYEFPRCSIASEANQVGLCLPWSEIPKTGFLRTRLE